MRDPSDPSTTARDERLKAERRALNQKLGELEIQALHIQQRITEINKALKESHDAAKIEIARRAFGDALSERVNMQIRLGEVPVHVIREAMAEALKAIDA